MMTFIMAALLFVVAALLKNPPVREVAVICLAASSAMLFVAWLLSPAVPEGGSSEKS